MNKNFYISFLLLINLLFFSQKSFSQYVPPQIPETSLVETWNGLQWSNPFYSEYTFNSNCLPLTSNIWSNGVQTFRSTWQYLNDELATQVLVEIWNQYTLSWENHQLSLITYSNNNLDITFTNYSWIGNAWVELSRQFLFTNQDDLLLEEIYQEWNTFLNDWENVDRDRYIYDINDILQVVYEDIWNQSTLNWDESVRATRNYNASDLLESVDTDIWSINQWVDDRIGNYTYNAQDQVIEWVLSVWDTNSSMHVPSQRQLYSDFGDQYPETILYQTWVGNAWFNSLRDSRTYPNCNTLSNIDDEQLSISVYPTKIKDLINIESSNNEQIHSITVYDMIGKEVFESSDNLRVLNLSHLDGGTYILLLESENQKATFKIIKE